MLHAAGFSRVSGCVPEGKREVDPQITMGGSCHRGDMMQEGACYQLLNYFTSEGVLHPPPPKGAECLKSRLRLSCRKHLSSVSG